MSKFSPKFVAILIVGLMSILAGCTAEVEFRANQVGWLTTEHQQLSGDDTIAEQKKRDVATILVSLFGTPDNPSFPFLLGEDDPAHELVDLENLQMAAGPVRSERKGEPYGLFREHCAHCHGITGDGAGPTASLLNPYPRDFRLGKFKYKSTKLGRPPTDEDLTTILRNGVPGTAMPSFRTLSEKEIAVLVDYVKYLSIRGETEYRLMNETARLNDDERLIDFDWRSEHQNIAEQIQNNSASDELLDELEEYEDQLALVIEDTYLDVLDDWLKRKPTSVPEPPPAIDPVHDGHQTLVEAGRDLFVGKGNCAQCHGDTGLGDGQTENFDDWTGHWVKGANVDPRSPVSLKPFIEAGAFPPRTIRPRNLRHRVYRGGDRLADLFRRVANGIEGTGMADSSALTNDEIWALVAYVRNLPFESSGEQMAKSR